MRRIIQLTGLSSIAVLLTVAGVLMAADPEALVVVAGDISKPERYTLEELQKLPATKVTARERDGATPEYTGVLVAELLRRAGAPMGEQLRGRKALATAVVVPATDGYQSVFSIAELDPDMASHPALLAWSRNGEPLPATLGPLRLVVPDDKKQARWVRKVTAIEVVSMNRPAITNAVAASLTAKP
jgi:DMSO/TMAO reductase YedYZ molybdopterin-dependent catalytic subunit